MDKICEIVPSQKRIDKINVRGFLIVKNKYRKDTYYWYCEKRKSLECKGRAITKFINNLHYLKHFSDHNHSLQASSAEVAKSIAHIKEQAKETNDQPAQVIQNTIVRQSGWRKIQEYGLSTQYGIDENLSINLQQLFALAFLLSNEIPAAFDVLKEKMLPETNEVV
ncbi:15733_t:CDS:2 [Gigaspora rosea]|nr:15733_t:CDS:2 [Gigaspora rosea]